MENERVGQVEILSAAYAQMFAPFREAAAFQVVARERDAELDEARRRADDWERVARQAVRDAEKALEHAALAIDHCASFWED